MIRMPDINSVDIDLQRLRRVDLNTLLVLHALLETRNVSLTAQRLHRGQPAISHTLSRLRKELDDPLLIRSGRQNLLTAHAESLRAPLARLLAQMQALIAPGAGFSPGAASGVLRLAMPDLVEAVLLPPLAEVLQQEAPGLCLHVEPWSAEQLPQALAEGQIDAALGATGPGQPALEREVLFETGIRAYFHPARLQLPAAPDLATLAALPQVGAHYTNGANALLEACFRRHGLRRNLAVITASSQPLHALLSRLPMLALLPEVIGVHLGPELTSVPFPDASLRVPVELFWHSRHAHDARHRYLRETIKRVALGVIEGNPALLG